MVYRYLVLPAVMCAGLLLGTNAAQAQKGGHGGGGGGAHVSGGGGAHVSGGGSYHGGTVYRGGYGYRGSVVGIGIGVGPYYGYGYGYPYGYSYYDYPVVVPRVSYYPAPIIVGQVAPADPLIPAGPQPTESTSANVHVLVPDGGAKVWFDGNLTTQTGADRLYHTPSLSGAGPFSYRIRATWLVNGKEVTQEAAAQVIPGQTTNVDFTRPASEPLPQPLPKKE